MTQSRAIFVVNAGSSSLKFQCFSVTDGPLDRLYKGQITGIGVRPHMVVMDTAGGTVVDETLSPAEMPDLPAAIAKMSDWIKGVRDIELVAMGHRVVHGGPDFAEPVQVDADVLAQLSRYQDLAPLHQPNNLAPIRMAMDIAPDLPQVACFDTAFHRQKPAHVDTYALPKAYFDAGVRRYGFHGLSYEYIALQLPDIAPELASGRVIVAHLGSGASMCAMKAGVAVESTMGFTALDGLPMSTRPGQLDPGVVLYLMEHEGMSAQEITHLLYHDAGLKGLSQISGDMRVLEESESDAARFAIDHFVYRCAVNIGMLAGAMEGLDGLVFTAGIGENSAMIRARIAERIGWLGAKLDAEANIAGRRWISTPDSKVGLYVVPTDEEWIIARDSLACLCL